MNTAPLAIVGIGCLFPRAHGAGHFWANCKHGDDGITPVPPSHWSPDDYFDPDPKKPDMTYARRGGFLSPVDFNPLEFGIAPRDLEATDTTQLLGLVAAKQALADARVTFADPASPVADDHAGPRPVDRSRVSVILGVTGTTELVIPLGARLGHPKWKRAMQAAGVPDDVADDACARIADSYVPWQENSFPGLLGNVVAGRIANRLDLHGTNCVVDAACASSLSALHLASMELQAGKADVVVTGGCDTFNDIFMYMCFSKTPALSPTGDSKPFDAAGDGTILGEGLGMVVLKRLADAERDGDTVYAVLKGIGTSSDGKGNAIYAPSAAGQVRCLTDAYAVSGVDPATVELVEAHGTGTKVGDGVEAQALATVYGESGRADRPWCALGSVKSQIGHTKAAAGAAGLIKAALALHNKVLPPTIKVSAPVEPLTRPDTPFTVNTQMRPWLSRPEHPRRAAVSAFGFGGSNFHAVLEEHTPTKTAPDWDGRVEILALSGPTPDAVREQLDLLLSVQRSPLAPRVDAGSAADAGVRPGRSNPLAERVGYVERLEALDWPAFARAAGASRAAFDAAADCRLLVVAHRDSTDLKALLADARAKLAASAGAWELPAGVYFGRGKPAGELAVLFPGQGSQAVGMLRELACTFPEALDTLQDAGHAVANAVYPPANFSPGAKERQDAALRSTDVAQPALGAVSLGAWRVLSERFGVTAGLFAGHSYGELTALAAAGRIDRADFARLSRARGELMAKAAGPEAGGMLAVLTDRAAVERVIAAEKLGVVVANHNAPAQVVVSGPAADITRADAAFRAAGVRCVPLPVAAAFHSRLVAEASAPFHAELQGTRVVSGAPVYANTTAAEYPDDAARARDLLGEQLARPVEFVRQIEAMHAAGARTFLEVGPGGVLARLAGSVVTGEDVAVFALDPAGGRGGVLNCAHALARLAARGHAVDLGAWEAGSRCQPGPVPKPGHTVPVGGANVVAPRPARPPRPAVRAGLVQTTPPSRSSRVTPDPQDPNLSPAVELTRQSIAALQALQEQTARLHQQFLSTQAQAQDILARLVGSQQALFGTGPAAAPVAPVPFTPAAAPPQPAPVAVAPPVPAPQPAAVAAPPRPAPPEARPAPAANGVHAPAKAAPAPAADPVVDVLREVVAEKTGYPVDMIDLDAALDADLGVDSIKRVEILGALQDRLPDAPAVRPEHLGALHTLRDIADFLRDGDRAVPKTVAVDPAPAAVLRPAGPVAPPEPAPALTIATPVTPRRPEPARPDEPDSTILFAGDPVPSVETVLREVVAEKTGYPVDMIDLDAALDADLGVDSIKRVEILGALQDRLPDAPAVRPEHLGALHTLRDIARFLGGPQEAPHTVKMDVRALRAPPGTDHGNGSPAKPARPAAAPLDPGVSDLLAKRTDPEPPRAGPAVPAPDPERVDRSILQSVDLDAAGTRRKLALPAGGAVWLVAPDADPFAAALADQFAAAGYAPKTFPWAEPGGPGETGAVESGSSGDDPAALVLVAPVSAGELPVNRLALRWAQACGPKLRAAARTRGAALFAAVARLDGEFGLGELSADADPTAGGLAGLVKTAKHEWPDLAHKAVDADAAYCLADPAGAAAAVADELLHAGPVEVGVADGQRCTLELARAARRPGGTALLTSKDVVLVSGGGRGVTAEVAVALAKAWQPTLILTGRTPAPAGPEPDWLARLTDEPALKKAIADHLGAGATPKAVGEFYARTLAQREVAATLAKVEAAGGKAAYHAVSVANGRQMADLIHQVQVKHGPVTALVHGAGVLADRRLEDLTPEQFDTVYTTKVAGLRTLLDLLAHQDLKAVLLFSSTTARFGRVGQAAYAMANEVLNKTAQVEARRRPGARVVAVNWGPWEGGMVTPALRKVFETENVGLIPLADGAAFAVHELDAAGRAVEVVALGRTPPPPRTGGSGVVRTPAAARAGAPANSLTVAFERTVDVASHPVLAAHVLNGHAVLPMAVHLEWLAHAALHSNPGLQFHGVDGLRIVTGVKVDAGGSVGVRAYAGKATKSDRGFVVPVELRGTRAGGRDTLHSQAEVILAGTLPAAPKADPVPDVPEYPHSVPDAYQNFLFHGPALHGLATIAGTADTLAVATANPAPAPGEWFRHPAGRAWAADPLVLDASFQLMILWTTAQHGAGSLPCLAGKYRQYRRAFGTAPVTIVCRVTRDNGQFVRADIDYLDADGSLIARLADYECIIDRDLDRAFKRNVLAGPATA